MNTINSINLIDVCRICLQYSNDSINIFDDNKESKIILDKIYLCFQIILNSESSLPNKICINCIGELNAANNFRLKCISFDERFTDFYKGVEKDIVIDKNSADAELGTQLKYVNKSPSEEMNTFDINENCSSGDENDKYNENMLHYKCNMCNKILKSKLSLSKHKISMHQKRKHIGKVTGYGPTRRYNCTRCTYSTPHSQTLVNHMRRHDGERPYHCECGKTFTQSSSLAAHQKIHSNTTYFTCSTCGKQFKHAYTLKKHQHVHENGKLICTVCRKVLKSKQSLQDHMFRHYNIKNFSCEECGDTFVTSSELISHRKKHDMDKRVECSLCGYKTHTKKSLIIHLKRHTGDKHFKCDLCEVTFYTQGDVRRHRRVHTREKLFGCPTCTQRFTYSTSLNKHMYTVHGVHYKWGDFKHKEAQKKAILEIDRSH